MSHRSAGTILVAGGGTGGHVFPGIAVAHALSAMADVRIVFVGTARGIETRVVPREGFELELLDVEPMKGGGPARAVRGAIVASRAMVSAVALLTRLAPGAILCTGGYAAGPISLAGAALGVPLAVLEPNSVVGLANRLLAPLARRAFVAWDGAVPAFRTRAVRLLGVPVRKEFSPSTYASGATSRVLVLGGSRGAAALNDRLPEAIAFAKRTCPAIEVLHQAGRDDVEGVRKAYARERVTSVEVVPFLDDVAAELARTDLVVARAGAVTLAELCAVGRPSLLIPFPFAADDHQAKNALALAAQGAAVAIRQEAADATRIGRELARVLGDDALRRHMADTARSLGKPSAADDIARELLALGEIPGRAGGTVAPSAAGEVN